MPTKPPAHIEVLMVDDYRLCRTFFAEGLRHIAHLLVKEVDRADQALAAIADSKPDVVLLNLSMHHVSGMSLLQTIHRRFPGVGLLVFSYLHLDHLYAERAICSGAAGYISVYEPGTNLPRAIERVAAGGVYLSDQLRSQMARQAGFPADSGGTPFDRLSHREFEVFCLTGHGHVPKRIAERMQVSVKTVETYRERIREKLNLPDGADLLYHASEFVREQSRFRGVTAPP